MLGRGRVRCRLWLCLLSGGGASQHSASCIHSCVSEWGIYSGLSLLDGGKEGMVVPVTPTPGLIGSDRALWGGESLESTLP